MYLQSCCLSEGSLVKGEYVGLTMKIEEGVEAGSNVIWEWRS